MEHVAVTSKQWSVKSDFRLIALTVSFLCGVTFAGVYLIGKSVEFKLGFLANLLLSGFTISTWALLVVLIFVLGRVLTSVFIKRRHRAYTSTLKAKLVLFWVSFALLPAFLIVLIGGRLISNSLDRFSSYPVEGTLIGTKEVLDDYFEEKERSAEFYAQRLSLEISEEQLLDPRRYSKLSSSMEEKLTLYRLDVITVLSSDGALWTSARPGLPNPESTIDLAEVGLRGDQMLNQETLNEGTVVQYVVPVVSRDSRVVEGAVVVSYFVDKILSRTIDRLNDQVQTQKQPIKELYLSFFFLGSLLLLVSSTLAVVYLAKRAMKPSRDLLKAAEGVMAGIPDNELISEVAADELGLVTSSFNRMATQVKVSGERLKDFQRDLQNKNRELERRRTYMETVLENIATGVISLDREGLVTRMNQSALQMFSVTESAIGQHYRDVFGGDELSSICTLLADTETLQDRVLEEELELSVAGRELHVSVSIRALMDDDSLATGRLVVMDDLTQLLRAQKVAAWREVARSLAHEIKNPLTPIQLSAQRIRKHFLARSKELDRVVEEGTGTIVDEVDSLKTLLDEFSQFARMPAVLPQPSELAVLLQGTLDLYDGLFADLVIEKRFAVDMPRLLVDPEQIRRVFINVIDNAVEATGGKGTIVVETTYASKLGLVMIIISDDGPGISPEARDNLFLPYYSTKRRGSGLGLAIVQRIVADHHGKVYVEPNKPKGTRIRIELPIKTITDPGKSDNRSHIVIKR